MNPMDPLGPGQMVVMASEDPREEMAKWYGRAMRINPDSTDACSAKAWWLERHGFREEEMAFLDECVKAADFTNEKLFLPLQVHRARAMWSQDQYYERPDVFPGLQLMYEKLLSYEPDNREFRSWYAFYATKAKQWSIAKKQFDILGDNPNVTAFGSKSAYELNRNRVTKMLGESGGK